MALTAGSLTELNEAAYLLEVFATLPDFKADWDALAVKHDVHITTASRRFKAIVKRNGYNYENGKVFKDGEIPVIGGGDAVGTPSKAKAKRGPKSKATPTPKKKQKLSGAAVENEGENGMMADTGYIEATAAAALEENEDGMMGGTGCLEATAAAALAENDAKEHKMLKFIMEDYEGAVQATKDEEKAREEEVKQVVKKEVKKEMKKQVKDEGAEVIC